MALHEGQIQKLIDYSKMRLGEKADSWDIRSHIDSSLEYKEAKTLLKLELFKFLRSPTEQMINDKEVSVRNLVVKFEHQVDEAVRQKLDAENEETRTKEAQALAQIRAGGNAEAQLVLSQQFGIIKDIVKTVALSNLNMAIIHGKGGISKSYSTLEALNELGKAPNKDYHVITGHITPLKIFQKLYEHRAPGEIIVLDDISVGTLKIPLVSAMLKAAGWSASGTRTVEWLSSSKILEAEGVPSRFIYEGKILLLANSLPYSQEFEAVKTRALTKEITLNFSQLTQVFYALAKLNYDAMTEPEKLEVCDYLLSEVSAFHDNLQLRLLIQAFEIRRAWPERWKSILIQLLNLSPEARAMKEATASSPFREDQARKFQELTGLGRRTFFNRIRQYGL